MAEKIIRHPISERKSLFSWLKITLIGILLLSLASYCLISQYSPIFSRYASANRSFILTITSTFMNKSPQDEMWNLSKAEKTVGLFMNNTWQTVYLVNASHPIDENKIDADGNPVASLSLPKAFIPHGENLTYQITYRIILKPHSLPAIFENQSGTLDDIREELKERYCKATGPWQVNQKELRDLAFRIACNETKVLSLLKRLILWIKYNVYYESQDFPKYPVETLRAKAGDCDDQANLLIAFCRILGIPAYLQVGCIYLPQRDSEITLWNGHWTVRLTRIGWHGWAMVYVPPWGWLPVDLTYVSRIFSDPISAIRKAAVITHPVVQYANITETDYIAFSRRYQNFLLSNGFKIYEHDVISEEPKRLPQRGDFRPPWFYMPPVSPFLHSAWYSALFVRSRSARFNRQLGECL